MRSLLIDFMINHDYAALRAPAVVMADQHRPAVDEAADLCRHFDIGKSDFSLGTMDQVELDAIINAVSIDIKSTALPPEQSLAALARAKAAGLLE